MKHFVNKFLPILAVALSLISCGSGNKEKASSASEEAGDTYAVMGRERAADMFETCEGDTTEISLYLLDTHACMNQLELEHGAEAAESYRHAFEDYVKAEDPVLAARIF